MCRLSRNSGASTSRNPKHLSRPVAGKLYLYLINLMHAIGFSETSVIHKKVIHTAEAVRTSYKLTMFEKYVLSRKPESAGQRK
jgi:hypothetical protein